MADEVQEETPETTPEDSQENTGNVDETSPTVAENVPGQDETPVATEEAAVKEMRQPEYSQLTDTSEPQSSPSLSRFLDVEVTVSAVLGRVTIPIGELVLLGEGSVVELNRSITSPVDLMAQGQRVATGEVVVIDDCFAIRIKSIDSVDAGP